MCVLQNEISNGCDTLTNVDRVLTYNAFLFSVAFTFLSHGILLQLKMLLNEPKNLFVV